MGRILLIIGGILGGLVLVFGVLGVVAAYVQPDSAQSDEVLGGFLFIGAGLVIAVPCIFFAYRMTSPVASGMQFGSANLPVAGADAEQRYLQWFTWCQQAIGGDAITLHAATMAALRAPDDPTGAAQSEASRQATRSGTAGAMPPPPNTAKVKTLARIGASTLGVLGPSERVLVSFSGTNRSAGAVAVGAAFGVIGSAIAAGTSGSVFVTVTDSRVIALIASAYGGLAGKAALVDSRATVTARFPKGLFGSRRPFTLKGMGGTSVSAAVSRPWMPEALTAIELLGPSMGQVGVIR